MRLNDLGFFYPGLNIINFLYKKYIMGFGLKSKIFILIVLSLFLTFCEQTSTGPDSEAPTTPTIHSFSASSSTIKRGENTTLSWNVSNCTRVEIDHGIGDVSFSGSMTFEPRDSTTYRLWAYKDYEYTYRDCEVEVEDGARVVMISGPTWKEDDWSFTYFGKVKNRGIWKASFTKIYISLYNKNGGLITTDYCYADKTEIKPGSTSNWDLRFSDFDKSLRKKVAKGKTKYEIEWSEYSWISGSSEAFSKKKN